MSRLNVACGFASAFVLVMALPATSQGQVCATNGNCPQGTTCQVSGVEPSKGTPVACPRGETCTDTTPAPAPVQTIMSCQAAPCQADADCGTGMVCHSETSSICSGGATRACAPDTVCDGGASPVAPTCTQTTTSRCAFKWQLPCNTDQDCGADFLCFPTMIGSCSGGTGVAPTPAPGGSAGSTDSGSSGSAEPIAQPSPLPPEERKPAADGGVTCTTTVSFPGTCQPRVTSCTVDADCPASWLCVGAPTAVSDTPTSSGSGGASSSRDAAVSSTTPAGSPPPDGGTAPTGGALPSAKVCQPPGSYPVRGGGAADGAGDINTTGAQPPTTGGAGGTTGTTTGGPTVGSPGAATESASTGNAGCATAGASSLVGTPLLLSALLGLLVTALLSARRRAIRGNR